MVKFNKISVIIDDIVLEYKECIMQVSSNMSSVDFTQNQSRAKSVFTQKLTKDEIGELKEQIAQSSSSFMFKSTTIQDKIIGSQNQFEQEHDDFQSFLTDIGYGGKPIAQLSQAEATDLVSEDGFFGIDKTSQRVADFVINGSGGNEEMMREGRKGVIQGYEDAKKAWGGELPEISQKTQERTLELIDKAMVDLGYSIMDEKV